MATEKKKAAQKFTTPVGPFKYPHLTEVDYGTKDYPNPNGAYNVAQTFTLADPAVQALLAQLQPMYDEAISEGKKAFSELKVESRKKLKEITINPLYTTLFDKETEEETGEIEFRFKMVASGVRKKDDSKWSQKPDLFDAMMQRIPSGVKIWGGTTGRVSFEAQPYFIPGTGACGLALKLKAAQIIKLVSSGERSAEHYGFGTEEGGFSASDLPKQQDDDAPAGTASDSDSSTDDGADGDF